MGTTEALLDGWEDTTPSADTLALSGLRAMADRTARWASAAGGPSAPGAGAPFTPCSERRPLRLAHSMSAFMSSDATPRCCHASVTTIANSAVA